MILELSLKQAENSYIDDFLDENKLNIKTTKHLEQKSYKNHNNRDACQSTTVHSIGIDRLKLVFSMRIVRL